jgi:hypothetical protein
MIPPPPDLNTLTDALEGEVVAVRERMGALGVEPPPVTQLETAMLAGEIGDLEAGLEETGELERQGKLWGGRTVAQRDAITRFSGAVRALRAALTDALESVQKRESEARARTGYRGMNEAWRDPQTGQLDHPAAHLPLFAELIAGQLEDARSLRSSLEEGLARPHVLDDATLDRVLETYRDDGAGQADPHRWQLRRWAAQALTDEQRLEVMRLTALVDAYQGEARRVLELERRLRAASVDRLLERSDLDDALLRGLGKKRG